MKILTLTDAYLPAYKHGGPVRTISAMVGQLPSSFEFWIATRDRDLGDSAPFPEVAADQWLRRGRAFVRYMAPSSITVRQMARVINDVNPDIVYTNSVFSRMTVRYLAARKLRWVPRGPHILAPRGELSPGALRRKWVKKRTFLELASGMGLFDSVLWQASTSLERDEITRAMTALYANRFPAQVCVARNICDAQDIARASSTAGGPVEKAPGEVRFVFVSRIVPKKNLLGAINALAGVRGVASLDVYGPLEDRAYWSECTRAVGRLPKNVRVTYRGELRHEAVSTTFSKYHFFVFPTFSENFGHVIMEALAAGCPVILSDQTPWSDIQDRAAGWALPLHSPAWSAVVQSCVDMGQQQFSTLVRGAKHAAEKYTNREEAVTQNMRMFDMAINVPNDSLQVAE